jgi:formylglycine-generating enzyme
MTRGTFIAGIAALVACTSACSREPASTATTTTAAAVPATAEKRAAVTLDKQRGFVRLPGGRFVMGTPIDTPNLSDIALEHGAAQGEQPAHEVLLQPFWIGEREVTVSEFAAFAKATGYRTESEQLGWSGVFDTNQGLWSKVDGANWRHPEGPGTSAADAEPVTHVSWNDAQAYARWAGARLPSEAEWEYAARGGLPSMPYVWGRDARPVGPPRANWWQGPFPERNTQEDGYLRRAPVGTFAPNPYGLYDMAGNVWEWCADWFDRGYYATSPRENPTGPSAGTERVMRGGSWLCADNFCSNYRPAARSSATPDTGLNNVGFRLAADRPPGG